MYKSRCENIFYFYVYFYIFLDNSESIVEVGRNLGVLASRANYDLVHRIIKEFNIDTSHFTLFSTRHEIISQ